MSIAGLVLAGGLSRRMGRGDKALRLLGGQPMIAHVIDRLSPQVGPLAISTNADPAAFDAFGLPLLADTHPGFAGPLAGVLTGMEWASGIAGIAHLATAATDTPFFPRDLVERMVEAARPDRIVMARSPEGRHPVFGLWPVALKDDLAHWLKTSDTMKVQAWCDCHNHAYVDFAPDDAGALDPFFNVNTPKDLALAEAHLVTLS